MTAPEHRTAQRSYSAKYRRANLAREAARARRWRKQHPGYSTPYVAELRGKAWLCDHLTCHNKTWHESGLCWRHRARRKASL